MNIEEMRATIAGAPRARLDEVSAALWAAWGRQEIGDAQAQLLADAIAARKASAPSLTPGGGVGGHQRGVSRSVGSRPRTPASIERRRRWVASGWLPPQMAAAFTPGESAALAVIACEIARGGRCSLPIGLIAARAGVCRTVVKDAVRQAAGLGLLSSIERRRGKCRSETNIVTLVSHEWVTWLARRGRGVQSDCRPAPIPISKTTYPSSRTMRPGHLDTPWQIPQRDYNRTPGDVRARPHG